MPSYLQHGDTKAAEVNTAYKGMNWNWFSVFLVACACTLLTAVVVSGNRLSPWAWSIPVLSTLVAAVAVLLFNRMHKRRYQEFIASGRIIPCSEAVITYSSVIEALILAEAQGKYAWLTAQVRDLMAGHAQRGEAEVARLVARLMRELELPADLRGRIPTEE